jgi:hypothetical protein
LRVEPSCAAAPESAACAQQRGARGLQAWKAVGVISGVDWFGLLGMLGLWLLMFGNDLVDVLLAWRFPGVRR